MDQRFADLGDLHAGIRQLPNLTVLERLKRNAFLSRFLLHNFTDLRAATGVMLFEIAPTTKAAPASAARKVRLKSCTQHSVAAHPGKGITMALKLFRLDRIGV